MICTFQSFFGLFIVDGKFGVDMKGFDIIQRKKHLYHICDTRCRNKEKEKEFCIDFFLQKREIK